MFNFLKSLNVIWLFSIGMIFYVIGETFSKMWAAKPTLFLAILVMISYGVGTFSWLWIILQKNQLTIYGLIWQILTCVITAIVGVIMFGEKLTIGQWIGTVLLFIALYLLAH